ncbi:MAG: hypothetical protein KGI57_06385, partial [Hyphomicrobiales bacterium]|nr:hypothetical protein [Hyphomicrobiales bacterium]
MRPILFFAAAGFGLAFASPAMAFDDGQAPVWDSVASMFGSQPTDLQPIIKYGAHPPLVLPKTTALPPPMPKAALGANWPVDPEVVKQRRAQAKAAVPLYIRNRNLDKPLRPDQLAQGRAMPTSGQPNGICQGHWCDWVPFSKLKGKNDMGGANVVAGVEPPRDYLTDPPKGYRTATQATKATAARYVPQPKTQSA